MTDHEGVIQALATASTGMTTGFRPADVLARLMSDCLEPLSADSAAILAVEEDGPLALVAASSHRVAEIELLQSQADSGPCVDVVSTGTLVAGLGAEEIERRWGDIGRAITERGYQEVHAFPLRWHGLVIGGLNLFRAHRQAEDDDTAVMGQLFADVATLAFVQATELSTDELTGRVHEAIAARSAVERAKGVLAYRYDEDMQAAYRRLVERADADGASLTETALRVVEDEFTRREDYPASPAEH